MIKNIFLSHCAISLLLPEAADQIKFLIDDQVNFGMGNFMEHYPYWQRKFKENFGALLQTNPDNLAMVKNTSEAMSMIALGYPFEPGDEVISYIHEYPANHYPWRMLEFKGVKLKLLKNKPVAIPGCENKPGYFDWHELESLLSPKTKLIALSHVQFTSGYAVNLEKLGNLCKQSGIDLVIDAAQSMGCMPIYPEKFNISAVASAGWKWLRGPFGSGVFYTHPDFRSKLLPTLVGAETMQQGFDYLDHTWNPHPSAKRFEYSSSPVSLMAGLAKTAEEISLEKIFDHVLELQDIVLARINSKKVAPLLFEKENRSGILSLHCEDPASLNQFLNSKGFITTSRGGYVRIAPFVDNTSEEMEQLADVVNTY